MSRYNSFIDSVISSLNDPSLTIGLQGADTARTESEKDLIILNIRSHIIYNEIQMLQK